MEHPDRDLYMQLGELTAEVRNLRLTIERTERDTAVQLSSIKDRMSAVESKVDALEGLVDKARGATIAVRVLWGVGGATAAGLVGALATLLGR